MSEEPFISILVAEDNDVSRQLMMGILEAKGYKVYGAINGDSAIKVIQDHTIHLALVDVNMAPTGGLEFVRYLLTNKIKLPVALVTGDESADLLTQASNLGVAQVIQKPVQPDRIIQTVQRLIRKSGMNPTPLAVAAHDLYHTPQELMQKTIALAKSNAQNRKGGPFAALVADAKGKIIATGTNRHTARIDPIAHAEVMAIRQAADILETTDLSDHVLYCSSYPTKIGQALIESVGIQKVYFGARPEETGLALKKPHKVDYEQRAKTEALGVFETTGQA